MKSSLMDKVINLRYFVEMPYDDFIGCEKIKMYNVSRKEEKVEFTTNKRGIQVLKNKNYNIIIKDRRIKLVKSLLVIHLPTTISMLLIIALLLISGKYIREITFENPDYYDYEVYQTINEHLIKKGPFYKLDLNLNDLGRTLRTTYQQYAYIGIKKVGAKLIVEIAIQEVPNVSRDDEKLPGDIVAKYDAYIEGIETKRGAVLVITSQSVKKGTLLISGNVNYKINPSDTSKLVRADGLILGRVAEYREYKVKKENYIYDYSSNAKKYYELSLFGKLVKTKKTDLSDSYIHKAEILNLFKLLKLDKVEEYKEEKLLVAYDEKNALSYAKSKIYLDFNLDKKSKKEYIENIELIKKVEDDEAYSFVFLVKSLRNIGEFKKYD
mgnify:CR=1 FL=1